MTKMVPIGEVVLNRALFPREKLDQDAVVRYRDAYEMGETLPPLVIDKETRELLDGWHRHAAQTELQRTEVAVDEHVVPEGVPPLLYAAALSSRHGVILSNGAKREVALRVFSSGASDVAVIASQLAVHRTTVDRWLQPLLEEIKKRDKWELEVRRGASYLLTQAGWTQQATADWFGVDRSTLVGDLQMQNTNTRLLTDSAYLSACLTKVPPDMQQACRQVIDSQVKAEREQIAKRREAAKARDAWREVEHAAAACSKWTRDYRSTPEGVSPERMTHIVDALTECITAIKEITQ